MNIGFIGLGKLGRGLAETVAKKGHRVIGHDIRYTISPSFRTVDSIPEVVTKSDITFIVVQTPHSRMYDGTCPTPRTRRDFDYSYLINALTEAHDAYPNATIAIVSTVLPGTCDRDLLPIHPSLAYTPSFTAMGTIERDYLHPEFSLIGTANHTTRYHLTNFFSTIHDAPILTTGIREAELIKMAYNAFIGQKITYANALMEICHKMDIDVDVVTDALNQATTRLVSPAYTRGGMGDSGPCLLPGELVMTECGPRAIESIKTGDRVLGGDGRLHRVVRTWTQNYSGEAREITVLGDTPTRLTSNHVLDVRLDTRPLYETTSRGKRITKRRTETPMSEALGPVYETTAGELAVTDHWLYHPAPFECDVVVPEYASSDYCWLAGWYLSEGWLELSWSKTTGNLQSARIGLALNESRTDVVQEAERVFPSLSPPRTEGRGQGAKVSVVHQPETHVLRVRYGSVELGARLYADFSKGAVDKVLPPWILFGDRKYGEQVLVGLYGGDGHVAEGRITYATSSVNLAWGVRHLLYRFGIPSHLRYIPSRPGGGVKERQSCYEVLVNNATDMEALSKLIGLPLRRARQDKRYTRVVHDDWGWWRSVRKVVAFEYDGPVHNLWVEDTNDYVTAIGTVHNCHPRDQIALSWLAEELDLSHDVFGSLIKAREEQTRWMAELVSVEHGMTGLPVVVLGDAYKPNIPLTDGSSSLLFQYYLSDYCEFQVYDPVTGTGYEDGEGMFDSPAIFFLATAHDEFLSVKFPKGSVVVDPHGMVDDQEDVRVVRVGRP